MTTADSLRLLLRGWRLLPVMLVAAAAFVWWATQVPRQLTREDRSVVDHLPSTASCRQARGDYSAEIACFRALQQDLARSVPDGHCVHEWGKISHEPASVVERGRGCCYSRSRLIEKALEAAGFEVRHLALYARNQPGLSSYLKAGVPSHSTTEALTSAGWVLVDSNHPFVGVDKYDRPHTALSLRRARDDGSLSSLGFGELPASLLHADYYVVYGLYSRHGGFYPPHVPLPDLDWAMFLLNLRG